MTDTKKKEKDYYITVRMEPEFKKAFEAFCAKCGITVSSAVNMFIAQVITQHKIPFEITIGNNAYGYDLEAVGELPRASIRVDGDKRAAFKEECARLCGVNMSSIIKMFMANCLNNGKLPF